MKITYLPYTKNLDKEVAGETCCQHLRYDEHIRSESRLQHDRHVRGVEEFDGVGTTLAAETVALDGDLDSETLQVNDDGKDDDGGDQVHDVEETLAPEGLAESAAFVVPGEKQVEERDNGTLELGATSNVDGGGREGLPDDGLADVGGNEQVDA